MLLQLRPCHGEGSDISTRGAFEGTARSNRASLASQQTSAATVPPAAAPVAAGALACDAACTSQVVAQAAAQTASSSPPNTFGVIAATLRNSRRCTTVDFRAVYLAPQMRRRGLAKAMVHFAMREAREQ